MDIANTVLGTGHPFMDVKRYTKRLELENSSVGDFWGVDDLLDFSNEDIGGPIGDICHVGDSSANPVETVNSSSSVDRKNSQSLEADGPGELCVPCDDLAELEWLSNFVEESFSSGSDASANVFSCGPNASYNGQDNNVRTGMQQFKNESPVSALESSACSGKFGSFRREIYVPARARSKRSRTRICFWNTRILSADMSANVLECSSTTSVTTTFPSSPDSNAFASGHCVTDSLPAKKLSKNNHSKAKKGQDAVQSRRCLHCLSTRTPQWRTGPMGPKTLCNACGVRYKSGRLLPEYRPAASPTFIESLHSNSHRKVVEMRRRRAADYEGDELQMQQEYGSRIASLFDGSDAGFAE